MVLLRTVGKSDPSRLRVSRRRGRRNKEQGTRAALLVPGEVMEVVHDGATQMAEDEPEYGLEDFLGCG